MAIQKIDNVYIIDYRNNSNELSTDNINNIISHTANTWQIERSTEDKQKDTKIGKEAENVVENLFERLAFTTYYPYDSFRQDDFKFHAPFDGIFAENLTEEIVRFINSSVAREGNQISNKTRERLRELNVITLEIKSTRLAPKYKAKANFHSYDNQSEKIKLVNNLMNLDFITYPYFTRNGDMNYEEYCIYANKRLKTNLQSSELQDYVREIELSHANDYYIRVFMDETNNKALVMGCIDRHTLLTPPETKKLVLPGKSEVPLYFTKPLKKGFPIDNLKDLFN